MDAPTHALAIFAQIHQQGRDFVWRAALRRNGLESERNRKTFEVIRIL